MVNIDWQAFITVFSSAVFFTIITVGCFSFGVRLLTNAQNTASLARKGDKKAQQSEALNMVFAFVMFGVCVCALAYGIWLIIPFVSH